MVRETEEILHSPFLLSQSIFVSKSVVCTTDQFFDTEQLCTKPVVAICFASSHDRQVTLCATMVKMTLLWDIFSTNIHMARTRYNNDRTHESSYAYAMTLCVILLSFLSLRSVLC